MTRRAVLVVATVLPSGVLAQRGDGRMGGSLGDPSAIYVPSMYHDEAYKLGVNYLIYALTH